VHKVVNYDRQVDRHFNDEKGLDEKGLILVAGVVLLDSALRLTSDKCTTRAVRSFWCITNDWGGMDMHQGDAAPPLSTLQNSVQGCVRCGML
jgi:hypothetical protein